MENNSEFDIASQFALYTNQHIFLTGKAGSGKTTLLKHIAEKTTKNFVIVAPTGVAAINAGGTTIHSMFHLPLSSFVPSNDFVDVNLTTNRKMLLSRLRLSRDKRRLIEELDLLIIDEVSMVRADILDAVDFVLKAIRRNTREPFGGVQVMLIGDMHQLPPVTRDHEWAVLQQYYQSPYFFDSLVWKNLDAVQIELKKIYRQSDEVFLNILNNIRNKEMQEEDYLHLEKRYNPQFAPSDEGYILLSTHNNKANAVNEYELNKLPKKIFSFDAEVEGEFPEHMFPCEQTVSLKEGAQVMFIRNDIEGNYYNGRLAKIIYLDEDEIKVSFNDNKQIFTLHRETWENISYTMDATTEKIEKKLQGTFSQYPLRLAWAITIHKSQGLTFDKVIIDAGQSFAAGQVYVALSRCRTLEGIVLHSRITQNVLYSDEKINVFSASHHKSLQLENILAEAKIRFAKLQLKKLFTFEKLSDRIMEWKEMIDAKEIPEKEKAISLQAEIKNQLLSINDTAGKFQNQLSQLLNDFENDEKNISAIKERGNKAIDYFTALIFNSLISPVHEHTQQLAYKAKIKKYVQQVQILEDNFWNKINQLYNASFLDEQLFTAEKKFTKQSLKSIKSSITSSKKAKGGTYTDTLDLYKQGKTIDEIASIRSLASSTIKSHFAKWILSGEIDIHSILSKEKVEKVEKFLEKNSADNFGALKSNFGNELDYGDIRMVVNHVVRIKKLNEDYIKKD